MLPGEAVDAPSLESLKVGLDEALSNLIELKMSLLITGCWTRQFATSLNQNLDPNVTEVNGKVDIDLNGLQLSTELQHFSPHGSSRQLTVVSENNSNVHFVMVTSVQLELDQEILLFPMKHH
ncbi:hypothetical protein BTVI_78791 [Pitangus sulphuratus]|nr:hypothetical protein BTVI_78791 [Pitangus sulphuratus]